MITLLDANVLLAMGLPEHAHHAAARAWFRVCREQGWATCTITEAAFVRVSSKYGSGGSLRTPRVAMEFLRTIAQDEYHSFWKLDEPVHALGADLQGLLLGPNQLNDLLLVDLARKRGGRLATFDLPLARSLSRSPELAALVEVVPVRVGQ